MRMNNVYRCFGALIFVLTSAVPSVAASRHKTSEVQTFFPVELPEAYAWVKSYATFPTGEAGLAAEEYMGVLKSFYWSAGRHIKPELLPDAAYVKEHIRLIPSTSRVGDQEREDVAFLRYRLDGVDTLIAQTGGDFGMVHLFLVNAREQVEANTTTEEVVTALANAYLRRSELGSPVFETKEIDGFLLCTTLDRSKKRRFVFLLGDQHAYISIPLAGPGGFGTKTFLQKDKWFAAVKDRWGNVPLANFRTATVSRIHGADDASARLADAMQENDIKTLVEFASAKSRSHCHRASGALAKTSEGRTALMQILGNNKARYPKTVLAALLKDVGPGVVPKFQELARMVDDPDVFEELTEAFLKGLPEFEARQYCVQQVEELANAPDESPRKVAFFLRGIHGTDDPPEVRLLRRVFRNTKNEELRERCLRHLGKFVANQEEAREDALRVVRKSVADANARVRSNAAWALGRSQNIRDVALLVPMLDDADSGVRRQAAEAICTLLGWERHRWESEEHFDTWVIDLKVRLVGVVQALEALDKATQKGAE